MLYTLHEMHHAAMTPVRLAAKSLQDIFTNPWVPVSYTEFGRQMAAGCELLERTTRRYEKPEFAIRHTTINGKKLAVTEETVLANPFCNLLHFKRDGSASDPRVLLVAPMSGHHATLLRGTVTSMLPDHDVYITDWLDARDIPVDELAELVGLSRYYLTRAFSKEFGLPPHAYATQVRLLAAKRMLAAGHSAASAAAAVGFYDQSHLNRLFKRAYGITPGTYAALKPGH